MPRQYVPADLDTAAPAGTTARILYRACGSQSSIASAAGAVIQPRTSRTEPPLAWYSGTYLSATPGGVVIDFWSNWCRRCLRLRPQLEQLAADLEGSGWSMVAVNAEAAEEAVDAFEVRSLPTIVFCVGGKEQDRLTGSLLVSTIAEQVERWTPVPAPCQQHEAERCWR